MHPFFRILLVLTALATFLNAGPAPADDAEADTLWKKVEDANAALNQAPEQPPASQEEANAYAKKILTAADEAGKAFTDKFPKDSRRWKIRLFDAMTASAREELGMASRGGMKDILQEVAQAPDADAAAKGEADAVMILLDAEELKPGDPATDKWIVRAEEHLKQFPGGRFNDQITTRVNGFKFLAELKKKPLDLKFTSSDGREVDLSKMRGKVVLLDFWATWCPPCVAEVPHLVKLYQEQHDKGFEIVGISLDEEKDKMDAFMHEQGMTWPQFRDGKGWEGEMPVKFGVQRIPAMWLFDKKGMLVTPDARDELDELVEKHLAE